MIALENYVNEAAVELKDSEVENLGYSRQEMFDDLELLGDYPKKADKVRIAEKYHIESAKIADIEQAIYKQFREYRKTAKSFDKDDLRMFFNLNVPAKEKFLYEGVEFLKYLKDYYWEEMTRRKVQDKLYLAHERGGYGVSIYTKALIKDYLSVMGAIEDRKPSVIASKKEKKNLIDTIKAALLVQTEDFHKKYIDDARKYAEDLKARAPKMAQKYTEEVDKADAENKEYEAQLRKEGKSFHEIYRDVKLNAMQSKRDNLSKIKWEWKSIEKTDRTKFVNDTVENAENKFAANITNLADRINRKEFDVDKLKVESISTDPKLFQLLVTDGTKNLYARSIWAAEDSELVTPHFRFIITNKKK